ncbi:hypothetical protein sscle_04g037080 [Sclerotinia sclerotiorum 1980 UF-70]|nr:hypothetical protein sscle_04g037080 [Sclerotinia sclerotiorum 1980 UF-70]
MCKQRTTVYTCGDARTSFHPCAHALENNITVMACPFFEQEREDAAEGDCSCSRCFEAARFRAQKEKAKRVCPSTSIRTGLRVVSGPKTGGGANPDYPTILEEDDGAEEEAEERPSEEYALEIKGKSIDREEHPNYSRASKEHEEYEDRPPTRASQRERPVAEPRDTPLKPSKTKTMARKMSDKMKQLAKSFSKKNGE